MTARLSFMELVDGIKYKQVCVPVSPASAKEIAGFSKTVQVAPVQAFSVWYQHIIPYRGKFLWRVDFLEPGKAAVTVASGCEDDFIHAYAAVLNGWEKP